MKEKLSRLFHSLYEKKITPQKALETFKFLPYEDLGFAKVDLHRGFRMGFPEIIYCEGKTPKQVVLIAEKLYNSHGYLVASRATREHATELKKKWKEIRYHETARLVVIGQPQKRNLSPGIAVISAGTSDLPVAEEAGAMAESMGNKVFFLHDVGVAGMHRLLDKQSEIEKNNILIVVAGMDGILPTIVAGLFGKPVIAVPTSVGYGANFGGLAPLLTMLNSCAPGVVVVNINNGLGAGYFASLLNKREKP